MMFRPTVVGLIAAVLFGYGCSMSPADSTVGFSGVVEGVGGVLNHVKPQAAGFVVVGTPGVVKHRRHEGFLVARFYLDCDYQSDHVVSSV